MYVVVWVEGRGGFGINQRADGEMWGESRASKNSALGWRAGTVQRRPPIASKPIPGQT